MAIKDQDSIRVYEVVANCVTSKVTAVSSLRKLKAACLYGNNALSGHIESLPCYKACSNDAWHYALMAVGQ